MNTKESPAPSIPMREGVAFALLLLLCACTKPAERTEASTNPAVPVETLFRHDGCTVYRFYDNGRDHYFANCPANSSVVESRRENCGKNCTRTVGHEVPTSYAALTQEKDSPR